MSQPDVLANEVISAVLGLRVHVHAKSQVELVRSSDVTNEVRKSKRIGQCVNVLLGTGMLVVGRISKTKAFDRLATVTNTEMHANWHRITEKWPTYGIDQQDEFLVDASTCRFAGDGKHEIAVYSFGRLHPSGNHRPGSDLSAVLSIRNPLSVVHVGRGTGDWTPADTFLWRPDWTG